MDTVPEVVERISLAFEAKGATVPREKISGKLNLLVSEFGIPLEEAERVVTNELMREYNLSPSSGAGAPAGQRAIRDLQTGEWVTVEGKVVSVSSPPIAAIAQSGIIADSTGAISFTIWAKANVPPLENWKWYRLEAAVVDEYRGVPKLNLHSGTKIQLLDDDRALMPSIIPIQSLKPGVGSIRAKFIQEWEPRHERMLQTGLLGDATGTMKFIIWKEENKEKLVLNTVYSIHYATVEEFNGRLSLNLTSAAYFPEEGEDIDVASSVGTDEIAGVIVHMGPGSGLIKRCPVEGCNKALSRYNECPIHEIQREFRWDLRITGVIDDGGEATNILVQRDIAEKLSGMTLDEAIALAENNPLGFDDVLDRMKNAVMGRYIRCRGSILDGTLLVRECTPTAFDPALHAALLNRAAPVPGGAPQ
ncbi:MAG: nucleotide-binding protein [Methanomicrobiales archaeon]|nr:nucleotide-binding protein [Methanomicrobiales archaeon]